MAEQRLGMAIDLAGGKLLFEIDAFMGGLVDRTYAVPLAAFCATPNKDQLTEKHA